MMGIALEGGDTQGSVAGVSSRDVETSVADYRPKYSRDFTARLSHRAPATRWWRLYLQFLALGPPLYGWAAQGPETQSTRT